jgi:hypothetical protein
MQNAESKILARGYLIISTTLFAFCILHSAFCILHFAVLHFAFCFLHSAFTQAAKARLTARRAPRFKALCTARA